MERKKAFTKKEVKKFAIVCQSIATIYGFSSKTHFDGEFNPQLTFFTCRIAYVSTHVQGYPGYVESAYLQGPENEYDSGSYEQFRTTKELTELLNKCAKNYINLHKSLKL